jgi:hypothetical protein
MPIKAERRGSQMLADAAGLEPPAPAGLASERSLDCSDDEK